MPTPSFRHNSIPFHFSLGFCIILFFFGCSPSPDQCDLTITNINIIDVRTGIVAENQTIYISGDSILDVSSGNDSLQYESPATFDGHNMFAVPGLWDMHVHFRGGPSLIDENEDLFPLFLDFGITTVRDAGGDITESVMNWRSQIVGADIEGPMIYTSGPKLDGPNPAWPGSIELRSARDVAPALDSLESLAVDFVKVYDGSLTNEIYYSIIREAESRGLLITGHMPMTASIREAIALGLDGTEHLYYVMKACTPKEDSLTALGDGYGIMPQVIASYDNAIAQEVFGLLASKQVYVTPTLHIGKTLSEIPETDHRGDPLLARIGSGIKATYARRIGQALKARANGQNTRSLMNAQCMKMIKPMHDAGVPLVAGSDCGPSNSYVYPGESLHKELALFVKAGLTPQEALITSIVNGPAFFGLEHKYCDLTQGKYADIILLEKNPLEDIRNLNSIQTVVIRGRIVRQ